MIISLDYIHIALIVLCFISLVMGYKKTGKPQEPVYVDRSGIVANPPTYIEVWKNKTINFKLGKESISINQIPILDCLRYVDGIAGLYAQLVGEINTVPTNDAEKMLHQYRYISTYNQIVKMIFKLSRPHAKNKRRFKRELFKRANTDMQFFLSICEEVSDYWRFMGKQIALLSQGKTIKMTHGARSTWNNSNVDDQGKISIKPRSEST